MHSSGMHTARLLTICQSAPGVYLPGGIPAQVGTCLGGEPSRGCTCQGGVPTQVLPPVNTLPSQTSFAGGKYSLHQRNNTIT